MGAGPGRPGVRLPRRTGALTAAGFAGLRLGADPRAALLRADQPDSRPGRSYRYCVTGAAGRRVAAAFTPAGRIGLVGSTAAGHRAGGIAPGARASSLRGRATSLGRGLWLGRRGARGARFAYVVRGGRVRAVAVVARSETRAERLRGDLRAAGLA